MAQRDRSRRGINGDYFDINQTNQPLNILVPNGELIARADAALGARIRQEQGAAIRGVYGSGESRQLPGGTLPLKTMNDWPPPGGGAVFITPEYGALRAVDNVTEYALNPNNGTPPFATYRVDAVADNTRCASRRDIISRSDTQAYGTVPLPKPGDAITVGETRLRRSMG